MAATNCRQNSDRTRDHQIQSICLILILTVDSVASIRPSQHGLVQEKDPGAVSPAMSTFFKGQPSSELPEAINVTEPAWIARFSPAEPDPTGKSRTVLLTAGVTCGVLGGLLLVAAVVGFHWVRSKRYEPNQLLRGRLGSEMALGLGQLRGKSPAREVRLGAAA